jgi:hypothetical protein
MSRAGEAAEIMAGSQMNCAQAVLSAFYGELGLDKTTALRVWLWPSVRAWGVLEAHAGR